MRRHKTMFLGLGFKMMGVLSPALALQTYPLIDQHSTHAVISQNQQNRIAVLGERIQQVFGAEGFFDVQSDDEGGQIFLKLLSDTRSPLEGKGASSHALKPITITIITESGLTQDLKLLPKSIESQSILFKPFFSQKEKETASLNLPPVITLMKAMTKGESLEGYTKFYPPKLQGSEGGQSSRPFPHSLKGEPLFSYKGEELEGKAYTLIHQGNALTKDEFFHLKEENLSLTGDVAIYLSKTLLSPGEKITFYVVSKVSPESQRKSENNIPERLP